MNNLQPSIDIYTRSKPKKDTSGAVEEIKKSLRPPVLEEEDLTELEYCRKYNKTFSMGQD